MKALTLRHPWPFAICRLGKNIENRTWKPPESQLKIGERFAIHGGSLPASYSPGGVFDERVDEVLDEIEEDILRTAVAYSSKEALRFRGIVATVMLADVVDQSESPWWDGSGYGWVLSDLILLPTPIVIKGAQGLWTIPPEVESEIVKWEAESKRTVC